MTDTQVEQPTTEAANDAPEEKPAKVKAQPHPCACASFEVGDGTDEGTYTTGCDATTMRTFAQGHDARLVSFLVDAQYDGYPIRRASGDGTVQPFGSAAEAAGVISPALQVKAEKAVANRDAKRKAAEERKAEKDRIKAEKTAAKEKEKADKAAAKAAAKEADAPKDVPVKVAEHAGPARIKVGRREYGAVIDDNGAATYRDGDEERTIERDGYRLLSNA